jgi:hypothetical protein
MRLTGNIDRDMFYVAPPPPKKKEERKEKHLGRPKCVTDVTGDVCEALQSSTHMNEQVTSKSLFTSFAYTFD